MRMDVMRDRGALAREVDGTMIENVYRLQIMNASENAMQVSIKASGLPNMQLLDSSGQKINTVTIAATSNLLIPVKVRIGMDEAKPGTHTISFTAEGQEHGTHADLAVRMRDEKSSFIVPR